MKKILFILVLPFFVCGFSKQEVLREKFTACIDSLETKSIEEVREICSEVVKIGKKSVATDMAECLVGMTYGEEEFVKNADKYGKNPIAHVAIGDHFFGEKNLEKAVYWYRKGASYDINKIKQIPLEEEMTQNITDIFKKNILDAQTKLGIILLNSENEKEIKEGEEWLEKAAKSPYDKALYVLGLHYLLGMDLKKDYEKSLKYLIASSSLGNVDAMFLLGVMSFTGVGARESNLLAFKAWDNAYKRNHPGAKLLLEYDDFDSYVKKLSNLKKITAINNDYQDIKYFTAWLKSDEARQYLHKKKSTAEETEKNMEWMSSFADYGIDFAIKYRVLYLLDFNEKEKNKK